MILANGAWRDRDLGVPGAEEFVDKGLVYQNPFIYWYNHKNEKSYTGPRYETPDEALVVGGGLASIDVVKVLQLENYERALKARGIARQHARAGKKRHPGRLQGAWHRPEDLGVKGCLLIYRRREQDMPLAQPPDNATPEQIAKTEPVRQKMLRLARDKYLFRVQDRRLTTGLVVENGRLVGLKVAETKVEGRRAEPIPGSEHELRAPLVISSIGSVPEIIPGVAMKGEYYTFNDEDLPRYSGCGSRVRRWERGHRAGQHSRFARAQPESDHPTHRKLHWRGDGDAIMSALYAAAEARGAAQARAVEERVETLPALSGSEVAAIEQRIRNLQERVGYTADYDSWITRETPPDLE